MEVKMNIIIKFGLILVLSEVVMAEPQSGHITGSASAIKVGTPSSLGSVTSGNGSNGMGVNKHQNEITWPKDENGQSKGPPPPATIKYKPSH
jgi:hypothetical protein